MHGANMKKKTLKYLTHNNWKASYLNNLLNILKLPLKKITSVQNTDFSF